MTAPDQCCINVRKLLSIRRRPHMTHSGHGATEIPQRNGLLPCLYLSAESIGWGQKPTSIQNNSGLPQGPGIRSVVS
jgi:hypothetical protein